MIITISGMSSTGTTTLWDELRKLLPEGFFFHSCGKHMRDYLVGELGFVTVEEGIRSLTDSGEDVDALLIDSKVGELVRAHEHLVLEGRIVHRMTELFGGKKPDVSILLTCPLPERIQRFAKREGIESITEASDRLLERDGLDMTRFNGRYGIAHIDPSDFHITLNSGLIDLEPLPKIAFDALNHLIGGLKPS